MQHAEFFHRNKLPLEIGKWRPGPSRLPISMIRQPAGKEFAAVSNNGYNRESDVASYLRTLGVER